VKKSLLWSRLVLSISLMVGAAGCKQDPQIMYTPVFDSPTNNQHFKTATINISGHLILSQTAEEKAKIDEAIKAGQKVDTGISGHVFVDGVAAVLNGETWTVANFPLKPGSNTLAATYNTPSDSRITDITVYYDTVPHAVFTANPTTGPAPLSISFDASKSSDTGGAITAYAWNFGDGTTGTGETISHVFHNVGNYTVTLEVTDNSGASSIEKIMVSASQPVHVPPVAHLTATPLSGFAPLAVSFDGSGSTDSDGTINNYFWNFGDNQSSTGTSATVQHIYQTAGNYTATLTVTDAQGGMGTATVGITVNLSPPRITYNPASVVLTKGTAFSETPVNTGGAISNCTAPNLPSGLMIDSTTCTISGTPNAVSVTANYLITATNASGFANANLLIMVNDIAPSSLSYTSPVVYTKGVAIAANTPSNGGGTVLSYSVSPTLPSGLTLNPTTGVISGTPTTISATTSYGITATNSGGFTQTKLIITVNDAAPTQLSYSNNPANYSKGTSITPNTPSSNGGGVVVSYAVSTNTPLPTGLALNPTTGVITGTPTTATPTANYLITATNTGGSALVNLSITVNDAAPTQLMYAVSSPVYTKNNTITPNTPSNHGGAVVSYLISPILPAGLTLDAVTGIISGTPTMTSATTDYLVTATNAGGSTTAIVNITVTDDPPSNLTYSDMAPVFTKNRAIVADVPQSQGGAVDSYSISPNLPDGLSLDPTTGIISGIPTTLLTTPTLFTITATNLGGSTNTSIFITVNDAAPMNLTYATMNPLYRQNMMIVGNIPSNTGGVITAYSVTPNLPMGLTLDSSTGLISGTPLALSDATNYTITGTNSSGVSTTVQLSIQVIPATTPLVKNLITVIPVPNTNNLNIVGAVGSSIPGITINASGGVFNTGSTISNPDGSFQITLTTFQSATLAATDSTSGQSSTVTLTWGSAATLLSGTVRDTNGNPLKGATASILGTTIPTVVTDASGVFTFTEPVTGDQKLQIDGTTITTPDPNGVPRKFSKTVISVSIGISQTSVLQRPIYLVPTLLDGSATSIQASSGGLVTNVNAPGATLNIPAGATVFPDGSSQSLISMATISSSVTAIPPFAFSKPDNVVALEPSGTKFTSPVTLTLPNDNNLPVGVQMVVMSMNSITGKWELDGVGQVDSGGSTVTTLPGKGITHFSSVYFSPIITTPADINGNGNGNGATLSKTVSLPSYKVLGQSYTPQLNYNTIWAKPSAFVSNLFDLSPLTITQTQNTSGSVYTPSRCFLFICGDSQINYWSSSVHATSWYQPNLITAQFNVENLSSPLMSFKGAPLLPSRSVVSFMMNLKDPKTNQFLSSGAHLYSSKYQMTLDHITVATQTITQWSTANLAPQVTTQTYSTDAQINQVFPKDLQGTMIVDNESNSAVGTGWKIGGVQKIADTTSNRLVLQEGNGTQSTFAINNVMSVLFNNTNEFSFSFEGFDLNHWPLAYIAETYLDHAGQNVDIPVFDLTTGIQTNGSYGVDIKNTTGVVYPVTGSAILNNSATGVNTVYTAIAKGNIIIFQDETTYPEGGVANEGVFAGASGIAGFTPDGPINGNSRINSPQVIIRGPSAGSIVFSEYGNNRVRMIDTTTNTITTLAGNGQFFTNDIGDGGLASQASVSHPLGLAYDNVGNLFIATANGVIRKVDTTGRISTFAGSTTGIFTDSTPANNALFNNPTGLVVDNKNGYLYVSDTGQNRVVRIDFQTMTASTVAGGGSSVSDNLPGLATKLSAPMALGLDPNQNLLIADTGNQLVRRLTFGNATTGALTFLSTQDTNPGVRQNMDGSWVPFLQRNVDGTWTRNYRNGNTITFDSSGHEVQAQDRIGNKTIFSYDGNGNLISATDPSNRSIIYTYSSGLLRSITDPAGRTTHFSFGANSTLTHVSYPDGSSKTFTYTTDGLMTSELDPNNNLTIYHYNNYDRLSGVTLPSTKTIQVTDAASMTAINNATGGSTGVAYEYGTDVGGAANSTTDANGNATSFTQNYYGFMETVTDPLGNITTTTTDSSGRPLSILQANGSTTTLAYNTWNDVISKSDSVSGITTSQTFDNYGNQLTSTNGKGKISTITYDQTTGLQLNRVDPLGHQTSYTYNSVGQIASVTDYLNRKTLYTFDSSGNVATITDPLLRVTTYTHDAAGNVTSVKDPSNKITTYAFDSFNRMLSVTTPKNETTTYSYLPKGQLASVTDPLGGQTGMFYDSMGNLNQKIDPLGFASTFNYDNNGNLISDEDPNGNVKAYQYNAVNSLIKKTMPDNVISMSYDAQKHPILMTDNFSKITFSYDSIENISGSTSQGLNSAASLPNTSLVYTYDNSGNRASMTSVLGTSLYSYDDSDRPTGIKNPLNEVYGYGYNDTNGSVSVTRPGSSSLYTVDAADQLTSITHSNSSASIVAYQLTRDLMGNITQSNAQYASLTVGKTITYDADYQVVSTTNPESPTIPMQNETFSYDKKYNRTSDQGGSYDYDSKSERLTQDYKYSYFYDNNGNLIKKVSLTDLTDFTSYTYSSVNQLLGVKVYLHDASNPIKEFLYTYDALGRRTQKVVTDHTAPSDPVKTFTRRFVYDGSNILAEYDGSNQLLAQYTNGPVVDDVLSVNVTPAGVNAKLAQASGSYMYLKDHLGSVVDVTDISGNRIQHYIYSAFGMLLGIQDANAADISSNPKLSTSRTFAGREFDSETGYYYNRARYYDPGIGRFLQKDPMPGQLALPITLVNAYAYTGNNPWNFSDPTGGSFWSFLGGLISGIAIAIASAFTGGLAAAAAIGALGGATGLGAAGAVAVGAIAGAIAGAATGIVVGGISNVIQGKNFGDNLLQNALGGAFAGGLAGAFSGASMYQSATQSTQLYDPELDGQGTQLAKDYGGPSIMQDPNNRYLDGYLFNSHYDLFEDLWRNIVFKHEGRLVPTNNVDVIYDHIFPNVA